MFVAHWFNSRLARRLLADTECVTLQVAETLDHFSELDDTEKFAGTPAFQPPYVPIAMMLTCTLLTFAPGHMHTLTRLVGA